MDRAFGQTIADLGIDPKRFEQLAASLVWRVGRLNDQVPLVIRVGLASSVALFNDLPKLHNATEAEIEAAMKKADFRVEWVGKVP